MNCALSMGEMNYYVIYTSKMVLYLAEQLILPFLYELYHWLSKE